MNPLSWSREHQTALCLAALIAAALATVLGYLVYAAGWGEGLCRSGAGSDGCSTDRSGGRCSGR